MIAATKEIISKGSILILQVFLLFVQQFPAGFHVGHDSRDTVFNHTYSSGQRTHCTLILHVRNISCRNLHFPTYAGDITRGIVFGSWSPPANKIGNALQAIFPAVVLQQFDQGTVAMRHILELFEGIILLCSGRDFPFPIGSIRISDVTGITVSDSSRCHHQDALYSDMIAPIASFFFGSTMK
nr:MAG TPA: hypothetical protein [Bacteriophage sp.]